MGKRKHGDEEKPNLPRRGRPPTKDGINLCAESERIGITRGAMGQRIRAWEKRGVNRTAARALACMGTPTSGGAVKRKPPRGNGDVARRARAAGISPSTVYKRMADGKSPEEAIAMGKNPPGPKKGTPRPPRPGTCQSVEPFEQGMGVAPVKPARRRAPRAAAQAS